MSRLFDTVVDGEQRRIVGLRFHSRETDGVS
jgi:hypothetical protein